MRELSNARSMRRLRHDKSPLGSRRTAVRSVRQLPFLPAWARSSASMTHQHHICPRWGRDPGDPMVATAPPPRFRVTPIISCWRLSRQCDRTRQDNGHLSS
jgi:hypothetical protein